MERQSNYRLMDFFRSSSALLRTLSLEMGVAFSLSSCQTFSLSGPVNGFLKSGEMNVLFISGIFKDTYSKSKHITSIEQNRLINYLRRKYNLFRSATFASRVTNFPKRSNVTAISIPLHSLVSPENRYTGNPKKYSAISQYEYSHSITSSNSLVERIPIWCKSDRLRFLWSYSNFITVLMYGYCFLFPTQGFDFNLTSSILPDIVSILLISTISLLKIVNKFNNTLY